jgi:hypothetical protein
VVPKKNRRREQKAAAYEADNRQAAEIILADPERYAGLPLMWAEIVLRRNHMVTIKEWVFLVWNTEALFNGHPSGTDVRDILNRIGQPYGFSVHDALENYAPPQGNPLAEFQLKPRCSEQEPLFP